MIIKSLSRKTISFGQLIQYLNRDAQRDGFTYNCWAKENDLEAIVTEFERNAQHMDARSNGNILYHEIIALPKRPVVPASQQIDILRDLVDRYVQLRCPENLVYAQVHTDTDHIHSHLIISANPVGSYRRTRLSKAEFLQVQRDMEAYKLEHYDLYPEQLFIRSSQQAISQKEFELKKRTQKPSRNDQVREMVTKALDQSQSLSELKTRLAQQGFELYQRGKHYGVKDKATNKKFRLKTLGLSNDLANGALANIKTADRNRGRQHSRIADKQSRTK